MCNVDVKQEKDLTKEEFVALVDGFFKSLSPKERREHKKRCRKYAKKNLKGGK